MLKFMVFLNCLIICSIKNVVSQKCSSSTTGFGKSMTDNLASLTVGERGSTLLEDIELLDELSHFNRERIPERTVHAKGFGAKGYFEVTDDITRYTAATVFSSIGKKTPIIVRVSSGFRDKGGADTIRDIRGFAIKFYTEDGIWDLVGLNIPVFFIKDSKLFGRLAHAGKRHPVTNLFNSTTFWDIITLTPESAHGLMWFFSDICLPLTTRNMNVYGVNTFKLVNNLGQYGYCKFIFKTDQGLKNLTNEEANDLTSTDPDYYQRDMLNAILDGNYPTWTVYIQLLTQSQADSLPFNPFDPTKLFPESEFPLIKVGKLVLNENVLNHFNEVEQIGFSPMNLIPGIQPTPDRLLQGRLFAYMDTQRYRLGPNFLQLPVNRPRNCVRNFQRDGHMNLDNQGDAPNYYPNSFGVPKASERARNLSAPFFEAGVVYKYHNSDEDNFSQAGDFYRSRLDDRGRQNLLNNIVESLQQVERFLQVRAVKLFNGVDPNLAASIASELQL